MTHGIHHITAISSSAQDTFDFYSHILGLRLVKKSVNQDDVHTYHLFFGTYDGAPGMDLTFFPFHPSQEGVHGPGMVNKIMLAVKNGSLEFWNTRLEQFSMNPSRIMENLLGDRYIEFTDWDGQILQIVETDRINKNSKHWKDSGVNETNSIKNFYGVEMNQRSTAETIDVIKKLLDFTDIGDDEETVVLENKNTTYANIIFVKPTDEQYALNAAGTVHHIAFRVKDETEQNEVRQKVVDYGLHPTPVIDRFYFKSVYFREPGGVLFEIATDEPGFTIDENIETLGEKLSLPPFIEERREEIENGLSEIELSKNINEKSKLLSLFHYYEVYSKKDKTIFLLHGTGGDEFDLFKILEFETLNEFNIISLRGNVKENGMNRFFKREGFGKYDEQSIRDEAENLKNFIETYSKYRYIKVENISFIGFSNGANMILASQLLYTDLFYKTALLHPANVLEIEKQDLRHQNVLLTYGSQDQMVTVDESLVVLDLLKENNAKVEKFNNDAGHNITIEEVTKLNNFISS